MGEAIVVFQEEIRCYDGYPVYNAGKAVLNVQRLECAPPLKTGSSETSMPTEASGSLTNALLVILIILVVVVGLLVIFYNRDRLHGSVKPIIENVQRSFQYRTINKEEETQQGVNV